MSKPPVRSTALEKVPTRAARRVATTRDHEAEAALVLQKTPGAAHMDLRARRTRQALYAAMLDLLQEKSFDEITMQEIAARAGAGRTTFFRHFDSKAALLDEVAMHQIDALVSKSLPQLGEDGLQAANLVLCEYVSERQALWRALLSGGAAPLLRQRYMERSRLVMQSSDLPHGGLPPELGMILATSAIIEVLTWWVRQVDPLPAAEVASIISRTIRPMVTPDR